jgi:hypothetical protein
MGTSLHVHYLLDAPTFDIAVSKSKYLKCLQTCLKMTSMGMSTSSHSFLVNQNFIRILLLGVSRSHASISETRNMVRQPPGFCIEKRTYNKIKGSPSSVGSMLKNYGHFLCLHIATRYKEKYKEI